MSKENLVTWGKASEISLKITQLGVLAAYLYPLSWSFDFRSVISDLCRKRVQSQGERLVAL